MFCLKPELAPITWTMGFIEAPLDTVIPLYEAWQRGGGRTFTKTELRESFDKQLRRLFPLSVLADRAVWIPTRSKWISVWDNFLTGNDPVTTIGYFSEKLRCRGLIIVYEGDEVKYDDGSGARGMARFTLHSPEAKHPLGVLRSLWSGPNDCHLGWSFEEYGEMQSFERRDQESRLTYEMLVEYCAALGLRPFDETFYSDEGVFYDLEVKSASKKPPTLRTLHEAQVFAGIIK